MATCALFHIPGMTKSQYGQIAVGLPMAGIGVRAIGSPVDWPTTPTRVVPPPAAAMPVCGAHAP